MTTLHSIRSDATTSTAAHEPTGERLVLTVAEAGQLLGISRAFAYELAARGELPVLRLGRRLLVPRRALLELVGSGPEPASGTTAVP